VNTKADATKYQHSAVHRSRLQGSNILNLELSIQYAKLESTLKPVKREISNNLIVSLHFYSLVLRKNTCIFFNTSARISNLHFSCKPSMYKCVTSICIATRSRNISVVKVTRLRAAQPKTIFRTRQGDNIYVFTIASRLALETAQPSIQYSHAPHNDVSVNDGPHVRRWSHKIIIL